MKKYLLPLIATLLFALACGKSPKRYLDQGNTLFNAGKYEDASINFRKAIQGDPKFGEAYYRLSLSELRQRKVAESYQALRQAAELMPSNDEVLARFAEMSLQFHEANQSRSAGVYDHAVKAINQIAAKNPGGYDALRLKGHLALIDRKTQEGIENLQKANLLKPMQEDVVLALTQALIQQQKFAEAERLGLEFIRKNKTYGPVYDVLYQGYLATNRMSDAEKVLQAKVANNPKQAEYGLELALHYARTQKRTDMAAALQRLLDNPADFPRAHLQVASFYAGFGAWEEATRLLEEGAKRHPDDKLIYQKRMASILLAQGKNQEVTPLVDAILRESPKDSEALRLRAALLLDTRTPENVAKAIAEFQALVKETPTDVVARFNLGRALMSSGNLAEARKELSETLRQNQLFLPARSVLAEIALLMKQPIEAQEHANQILEAQPAHPQARLLRAIASIALGNQTVGRSELTRLIEDQPGYADANLQLALLNIAEKKYSAAESIFNKLYRPGQADVRALEGRVNLLLARNQPEQALQLIGEDLKKSEQPGPARLLLARTAMLTGRLDLGIEQLELLLKENPRSVEVHIGLADALARKGDYDQAVRLLEKVKELAPKDPAAAVFLASAQTRAGRKQEAIANYRRALELQPDNPKVLNNLAYLLSETGGDLDEALKFAQRAVEKMRDQPDFSDTLGWIYLKKNMHDSAFQIFSNLVRKNPENATFHYHLAATLIGKGDKDKARAALHNALSKKPSKDVEIRIREALGSLG